GALINGAPPKLRRRRIVDRLCPRTAFPAKTKDFRLFARKPGALRPGHGPCCSRAPLPVRIGNQEHKVDTRTELGLERPRVGGAIALTATEMNAKDTQTSERGVAVSLVLW